MLIEINEKLNSKTNYEDLINLKLNENIKTDKNENNLTNFIKNKLDTLDDWNKKTLINNINDFKNKNDIINELNNLKNTLDWQNVDNISFINMFKDYKLLNKFVLVDLNSLLDNNNINNINDNLKKMEKYILDLKELNKIFIDNNQFKIFSNEKIEQFDLKIKNYITENFIIEIDFIKSLNIPILIENQVLNSCLFILEDFIAKNIDFSQEKIKDLIEILSILNEKYIYIKNLNKNNIFKNLKNHIIKNKYQLPQNILENLLKLKYKDNYSIITKGRKYFSINFNLTNINNNLIELKIKLIKLIDNDFNDIKEFIEFLKDILNPDINNPEIFIRIFLNIIKIKYSIITKNLNEVNISKFIYIIKIFKDFSFKNKLDILFLNICKYEINFLNIETEIINSNLI